MPARSGFRGTRLQFQDLIYQEMVVPGSAATQQTTVSTGLQIGLGTRASASEVLQTQGEYDNTGNSLDLAIQGAGFFQVKQTNGETAYTRAGSFQLDQQGNVVTANGNPLEPSVAIPAGATSISVGSDGTVTVTMPGQTNAQQVGIIQLATFPNPGGLVEPMATVSLPPLRLRVIPLWARRAGRKAWALCSKACWKTPTSTWWMNSSR